MNRHSVRIARRREPRRSPAPALARALAISSLALAVRAAAQGVLPPPPPDYFGVPPALETAGTNLPGVMPPPPATTLPGKPPLQWGPVEFYPHFLYRFLYGDGVPVRPGEDFTTAINEIYPGILMRLGSHWTLDYTPTLRYYSSSQFRDSVDHAVTLAGGTTFGDWTLGLSQGYASSSEPLVETGGQTDTQTYPTALSAVYQASSTVSIELGANQEFRIVDQSVAGESLTDSRSWSTLDWVNYQFSAKLGAALGAGFGYDNLSAGSDMTHEDLQARFTWRPGEKLYLAFSGGAQCRQFLDSGASASIYPIFGVSALYRLFDATTFSLGASRTVSPSYFEDQLIEDLTVSASLRQRLLEKLYLDLTGGYRKDSYSATSASLAVDRNDSGPFFNARLSLQVLKRGTVAVFYQMMDNSSTLPDFAYSSHQVGFELGYRF